ncbi:MAG: adenylate kinase family protein [Candidatus Nanopusillus acidilobi]
MIICITGVPGVGKSTIAKKLAEQIDAVLIDISDFAIKNKLYEEYDEAEQTYIVDENKLFQEIDNYIRNLNSKYIIIEGNFAHLYDKCDLCIVIKTDPNILYERLSKERNYPYNKIFTNIWAMNLEVIEDELEEMKKGYYVFYSNKEDDIDNIVKEIKRLIENKEKSN